MVTRIIADSSVDIWELEEIEFSSVPLTVSTEERSFVDDQNLDLDEMLTYLRSYSGKSGTSCPNVDAWMKEYEGADIIYVVTLSGNISGTYNAARLAAEEYIEEHPDVKIHIFDSKSAGPHCRLIVDKIAEYVREGKDFDEVVKLTNAYMKKTRVFFALESFHNFAENGRVNKTVAKLAGAIGIRIMATASPNGVIDIVQKCRGKKGTLKAFLSQMEKAGYTGGKVYMNHCENPEFANEISELILSKYPNAEISIGETGGLCSFYAEKGGMLLACETDRDYE